MQPSSRNYSYHRPAQRLAVADHAPRSKRRFIVPIAILSLLLVIGGFSFGQFNKKDNSPQKAVGAASDLANTKKDSQPKRHVDTSSLQATLAQTIKKYPYDTSVSVVDLNSGTVIQAGDSYPFLAASTTKILTALLFLNNVETGQASLDDKLGGKPAKEQLQQMINKSDNDAWALLNDYLSDNSLGLYAKKLNLQSYDVSKNTISSNDMASLLAKLYNRELLDETNTKLLLSWMQNTSEERFIPAGVPAGMTAYHKAGYLEDRVHDVAIIDNGSAPFALVIYSKTFKNAGYDYDLGQTLYKDVTTKVISVFK